MQFTTQECIGRRSMLRDFESDPCACPMQMKCDASDAASLSSTLQSLCGGGRPLAGVFHMATQYEVIAATDLDAAGLRLTDAKLKGALNLHRLTQELDCAKDIKHFVLFSSIAAVHGSTHQVAYISANTALQQLAKARQAAGLPALCLSLPVVLGAGRLSDPLNAGELQANTVVKGYDGVSYIDIFEQLRRLLLYGASLPSVVTVDAPRWDSYRAQNPNRAIYSYLPKGQGTGAAKTSSLTVQPKPQTAAPGGWRKQRPEEASGKRQVAATFVKQDSKRARVQPMIQPTSAPVPPAAPSPLTPRSRAWEAEQSRTQDMRRSSSLAHRLVRYEVLSMLSSLLGTDAASLDLDTPLPDLGLDSLAALELVSWAQERYGGEVALSQSELLLDMTPSSVIARIEAAHGGSQPQGRAPSTGPRPSLLSVPSIRTSAPATAPEVQQQTAAEPARLLPRALQRGTSVVGQLASLLGTEERSIDRDTPLPDLGLDSLAALELVSWVQERYGGEVALSQSELLLDMTPNSIVARISAALGGPKPHVATPQPSSEPTTPSYAVPDERPGGRSPPAAAATPKPVAVKPTQRPSPRATARTLARGHSVVGQLASLLGMGEGDIDRNVPLPDLGLDSLAALELVSWVQERYGGEVALSQSELLLDMTPTNVISRIVEALQPGDDPVMDESLLPVPEAAGGADDRSLLRQLSTGVQNLSQSLSRRRSVVGQLASLLGTDAEAIDLNTPLPDLGLDSLAALELVSWAQERYGGEVALSQSELLLDMTPNCVIARIGGAQEEEEDSPHEDGGAVQPGGFGSFTEPESRPEPKKPPLPAPVMGGQVSARASSELISPAAHVDPKASIGEGVFIGPFCIIGPNVSIGDGCRLLGHCVLVKPLPLPCPDCRESAASANLSA